MSVFLCCTLAAVTVSLYGGDAVWTAAASKEDYAPTMRIAIVSAEDGCTMYEQPGVHAIAQLQKNDILSYGNTTLYTELDQENNFWVLVQKDGLSGYVRADKVVFEKNAGRYALASESLYLEVTDEDSISGFQSADRVTAENLPDGIYQVTTFSDAKTAQLLSLMDDSVWYVDGRTTEFEVDFEEKEIPLGEKLVAYARRFLGTPYVWGGTSLSGGVDCSGFVQAVYAKFGYGLPRTAASQAVVGTPISMSDLQPGDLLFYVTAMPNPATGQYDEQYPYAEPSQEDIQKVLATMGIATAQVQETVMEVSMAEEFAEQESEFLPVSEIPETIPESEVLTEPISEVSTEPVTDQTEAPTEPVTDQTETSTEPESDQTEAPTEPVTDQTETPTESESDQTEAPTESESDQTEAPTEPESDQTEAPTEPETEPVKKPQKTQRQSELESESESQSESESESESESQSESESESESERIKGEGKPQFYIGHVTMYIGDGKMIHAKGGGVGITIDDISALNAVYACRIIP